jgi:hypothetical protein
VDAVVEEEIEDILETGNDHGGVEILLIPEGVGYHDRHVLHTDTQSARKTESLIGTDNSNGSGDTLRSFKQIKFLHHQETVVKVVSNVYTIFKIEVSVDLGKNIAEDSII